MNGSKVVFVALGLTLLLGSGSRAQAPLDPQFEKFIHSDFHKSLIETALSRLPPVIFLRCPTLGSMDSRVTVIQPVVFAESGYPKAGAWHESFPVWGCGNDTTLNFYFNADSDEKVHTTISFPGETRADPRLQQDAYNMATVGMPSSASGCKTYYVTHTKFDGFGFSDRVTPDPKPDPRIHPWKETWILEGCDRKFAVRFNFVSDPRIGGTLILDTRAEEMTEGATQEPAKVDPAIKRVPTIRLGPGGVMKEK